MSLITRPAATPQPQSKALIVNRKSRKTRAPNSLNVMSVPRLSGILFTNQVAPFPSRMSCKLRYSIVTTNTTSTTAGNIGTPFQLTLNDLGNTNGHQPYGFDTLRTIYNNFRVTRADVKSQVLMPSGATDVITILFAILPNETVAPPTAGDAIDRWAEVPGCYTQILGTGGTSSVQISQSVQIAGVEGLSRVQLEASPNYASFAGSTVAYQPYFYMAASNESSTTARGVVHRISVVYHAEFWQRKPLAQS